MLLGWKLVTFNYAFFVCLFYFIIGYFFFFPLTTQCQNLIEFSHGVSLVFLTLWQFLRFPLFFMTLTILKSKGQLFRGMTPIWICLMFSLWINCSSWLLGRIPQKWGVLLITSYCVWGAMHDSNMTYTQAVLILIIWSAGFSDIKLLCTFSLSILWKWVAKSSPHSWSCFFKSNPGSMHDTGCLGLVHWDDQEGWYGEGGGRRV